MVSKTATLQEPFHYEEATFRKNYPAWNTSDARNYTLVNEIWTPDPTVPPSQAFAAENLFHQRRDKKITTLSSAHGSKNGNIADFLCTLVREQAAPQVLIEPFDGNSLNFAYFLSMFTQSVKKKIEDPMGKLTRLMGATGKAQESVKHFICDKREQGYRNAVELLRDSMEILIGFWLHIEWKSNMSPIKPGDISAFRKLFNFLIKCQSLSRSSWNNPLDAPEIIFIILSKFPVHLQDRWNRKH